SAPPVRSRVASIAFAGQPGFDDQTLLAALDMQPLDRFDFFDWQEDRDRLERFYHDEGFMEATIAAERETSTGPDGVEQVALTYRIVQGPRTMLRFEGASLPGSLQRDLRAMWGRSVFDGFLVDDMRETIAAHLARDGYLQPAIDI